MITNKWRLIPIIEDNAAMQMAIDEAIVIYKSKNKVPNTLRFYIIDPPAITIGHNQKSTNINSSFPIIRRITGGSSVLHKDDLVYSLIVNENELPDKIIDAYKYLSEGLINGFKLLNIPAEFNKEDKKTTSNACYLNKNPYEIVVNQKKYQVMLKLE